MGAVAAGEPVGDGAAQAGGALVRGVAAELGGVAGDQPADEIRDGVLRLADGHLDDRAAGGHVGQQRPQTRKRVFRQV